MADRYEMTDQRWQHTNHYITDLFAREDAHLAGVMTRAAAEGLPPIDAGAATGKFLQMLAMMTRARLAIEVGTLAGYPPSGSPAASRPAGGSSRSKPRRSTPRSHSANSPAPESPTV